MNKHTFMGLGNIIGREGLNGPIMADFCPFLCRSIYMKRGRERGRSRPEADISKPTFPEILQTFTIIKYAVSTAISSPDYSNKSANKNPITSRSFSGNDATGCR